MTSSDATASYRPPHLWAMVHRPYSSISRSAAFEASDSQTVRLLIAAEKWLWTAAVVEPHRAFLMNMPYLSSVPTLGRSYWQDWLELVDMSSLVGGGAVRSTAAQLFAGFAGGLHAQKQSHHVAPNYRISLDGDSASLWAHGYAWNRIARHVGGSDLWETWGTYRLTFRRTSAGWRIDGFYYYAKHNRGTRAFGPTLLHLPDRRIRELNVRWCGRAEVARPPYPD
jgi:hypothetical protein